jgi:CSLREA domain-containing protein
MRLLGSLFIACIVAAPAPAMAVTWTVNSLADTSDGSCTSSTGGCTLREAIAALSVGDDIAFAFTNVPITGPVISLTAGLPDISVDNVTIDGFACTGCGTTPVANTNDPADGFNTVIGPTIDGSGMGVVTPLLSIEAENVTIRGLNLRNGPSHGIEIEDDSDTEDVTITGCFIGTDRTGTVAMPNAGDGIHVAGRDDHTIGPFNLISGNTGNGIFLDGGTVDDVDIIGNLIGTDVTASIALANTLNGIHAIGPTGGGQNLNGLDIGDASAAGLNVLSGNGGHGILFERKIPAADIHTNLIGVNGAQTAPLGNGGDGIRLIGEAGTLRHPRAADIFSNVISGNVGDGVYGEAAQDNDLLGNWIGTDDLGLATNLGNGGAGIHLHADTARATEGWAIGGFGVDANVIAHNTGDGVLMDLGSGGQENRGNAIYVNQFFANGGLAVDLAGNGTGVGPLVPGSSPCTPDPSLGNRGMPRPVITAAYLDGTTLTVEGTGCAFALVGLWEAAADGSGFGEPDVYIDAEPATGTGAWSVSVALSTTPVGTLVTAMQLDTLDDETSEASAVSTVVDCDVDGDLYLIPLCGGNDCDDSNPFINPGAAEVCNGLDDDCDGILLPTEVDLDNDGVFACFDCDDNNAAVNPSATELCNGIDDDCDTLTDEGFDLDADGVTTCGPDGIAGTSDDDCDDGVATTNPNATELCNGVDDDCDGLTDEGFDVDGDGVTSCAGDCDDTDAAVNPSATEVCNGVDDDCEGGIDEDFDADGDGVTTCGPDGLAGTADDDCDDAVATTNPNAVELCNGVDDDCDGSVDEDFDVDGDGVTSCGPDGVAGTADDDCDDGEAGVNPGATEVCDGVDNDCDGVVDEGLDADGDGTTPCGPDGVPGTADDDCDDTDAGIGPGVAEICGDGIDQDCDGLDSVDVDGDGFDDVACGGDDCDDGDASINPDAEEICADGIDQDCDGEDLDDTDDDGDGFSECDGDCDDADPAVNPDAVEECNGIDDDCDGEIDEDFPEICCDDEDVDGDGFSECDGDCDDEEPTVFPGAEEICDGLDNDCDGFTPPAEDVDVDLDGWPECIDCDDEDASINPGAEEICGDGIDNNCDGSVDDPDADGDGFRAESCGGDDCDDADASIHPGAEEICDDRIDQDCDGLDASCVDAGAAVWVSGGGCGAGCEADVARSQGGSWLLLLLLLRRRRRART